MKKQLLLAAAAVAALTHLSAQAATVSFSAAFSGPTNWSTVLNLPKFDASLGTLEQVELLLRGDVETIFRLENRSNRSNDVSQTSEVTLTFGAPASYSLFLPLSVVRTVGRRDGNQLDFDGTGGYTLNRTRGEEEIVQWEAADDDLSAFVGPGWLGVAVTANAKSLTTAGPNLADITTTARASAEVTYTFSERTLAVPEPGSMALAAAALGALALLRRRHR